MILTIDLLFRKLPTVVLISLLSATGLFANETLDSEVYNLKQSIERYGSTAGLTGLESKYSVSFDRENPCRIMITEVFVDLENVQNRFAFEFNAGDMSRIPYDEKSLHIRSKNSENVISAHSTWVKPYGEVLDGGIDHKSFIDVYLQTAAPNTRQAIIATFNRVVALCEARR